ncbi:unnamed protein product [Brugia pahangi]|uniref:Uncharacterized protein n=1 Tax=Brugia pahangi TaxID=6280 RepID=A0A0N4TAP5_BRUPA|nr:unnamed protein product [Brugia pahangi]
MNKSIRNPQMNLQAINKSTRNSQINLHVSRKGIHTNLTDTEFRSVRYKHTFTSESLFDRIFPFSPLERYKDTSLRHMSKGTIDSPPHGIVRNIPIKVERASLSDNDNGSDKLKSNTLTFSRNRHYQDEPSTPVFPYYQDKFERLVIFSFLSLNIYNL